MRYLSICSGIEAASVAWHGLGWEPVAFSEIEPFPSAVLAHHYPHVPNLGDMTNFKEWNLGPVDLLVGGTPCQAFSVAGRREGLADARGNLTLTFCDLADHFDPEWIVWENVPGVLSSKDNAFGCFLGALCGSGEPLVPDGKWDNAGLVSGPKRTIAWRVQDAQFHGVAQRRRRVFVLAVRGSGNWACARALFPVGEGVFWDSAPQRQAWPRATGGAAPGAQGGQWWDGADIAATLTKQNAAGGQRMPDKDNFGAVLQPVAHALRGEGFDASEDGTGRGTPIVPVAQPVAFHPTQDPISSTDGTTHAMGCGSKQGNATVAVAHAFKIRGGVEREDGSRGSTNIGKQAGEGYLGSDELAFTVASSPDQYLAQPAMQVRRLTPTECERLQGFPDGYTNIPWRKKPEAPDGPRYKALGNSMAVPCMKWIGERIQAATARHEVKP